MRVGFFKKVWPCE